AVGVVVNLGAAWLLSRANRASLNVEGAFQHILTDLFGFIATAVAGAVVLATGFSRADALATLVVVALMLQAGGGPGPRPPRGVLRGRAAGGGPPPRPRAVGGPAPPR